MRVERLCLPTTFPSASAKGWIILAVLGCSCLSVAHGEELRPPGSTGGNTTNAPLKEVRPGVFELGQVRFDKDKRTVNFPALVNQREGNLEYVIVTTSGKTHESLLRTTAEPYHLQVALLLLGAKGAGTNALPEDPAQSLPGDRIEIELSWDADGKVQRFRAEDFIHDRKSGRAASHGEWIYTGSRLREDGFAAQLDGSIVSLITDADALVNNPRRGREDDDNWLVRTNSLPALHAPLEVTLRLAR